MHLQPKGAWFKPHKWNSSYVSWQKHNPSFILIRLILKISNVWLQKLFTELKKLYPFLRCYVAKLEPECSFPGICKRHILKRLISKAKKVNNFWPKYPHKPIFCRVTDKTKTRNLQETDFWYFNLFSDFLSFSGSKSRESQKIWPESDQKSEKVKISKICFLRIFCFIFLCNFTKNGLIWVYWPKVITFFRFWKLIFWSTLITKKIRTTIFPTLNFSDKKFRTK